MLTTHIGDISMQTIININWYGQRQCCKCKRLRKGSAAERRHIISIIRRVDGFRVTLKAAAARSKGNFLHSYAVAAPEGAAPCFPPPSSP